MHQAARIERSNQGLANKCGADHNKLCPAGLLLAVRRSALCSVTLSLGPDILFMAEDRTGRAAEAETGNSGSVSAARSAQSKLI